MRQVAVAINVFQVGKNSSFQADFPFTKKRLQLDVIISDVEPVKKNIFSNRLSSKKYQSFSLNSQTNRIVFDDSSLSKN